MKKIIILTMLFISLSISAQTVKLKITYKDYPVQNSDITIKIGNATVGSGRTNNDGEVSVNCSNLITKNIDVYGSKQTSNSTKTWDVKGYVVLDNSNYSHLKMETFAKEMSEASGGFLSESTIAAGWGLTAGGKNESQNNNSTNNTSTNNDKTNNTTNTSINTGEKVSKNEEEDKEEPIDLNQMREENLSLFKQSLETDIIRYEKRILKAQKEIDKAKSNNESENDIRRLEIDKQIDVLTKERKEIQLVETNAKIEKRTISFEERKKYDLRKDQIKDEITSLKTEDKKLKNSGKSSSKEIDKSKSGGDELKTEKIEKDKYSEAEINNKSKFNLKKELTGFKVDLNSKKVNLKAKSSFWSQEKIAAVTSEIAELEVLIQKYENRLKELEEKELQENK